MMMKGLMIQQNPIVEENMSNLTSTSGDQAIVSSSHQTQAPALKRKRNLPGNPDPEAEVIALSPKTLMATNRFVCEICNKGFQRDQNLQLHRRGHNLPWKLKQRSSKEVRKRVYVCPENSCVHHDPSRALGDLTGIKKHFCRKHGEKKWKCDKCSKRYAVQSDWKAHSKTCGTREYRCDCGTLFSRRDSFTTHRAFCDALAEESSRVITANPNILSSQPTISTPHINLRTQFNAHDFQSISLKREQNQINLRPEIPPWLACPPPPIDLSSSSIFSTRLGQEFSNTQVSILHENPNLNPIPTFPPYHSTTSPHMSATALLQKAALMGATMSKPSSSSSSSSTAMIRPHQAHMSTHIGNNNATSVTTTTTTTTTGFGFGLGLSSCEEMESGFVQNMNAFGNNKAPTLFQDMMNSLSCGNGFDASSFEDAFGGMLNSKRDGNPNENFSKTTRNHLSRNDGGGGGNDGTRDFLGLRAFPHRDILNIDGIDQCMSSSSPYEQQNQNQKPWQG